MTEVYSLHTEQGDEYNRQHLHYAEMIAEGHAKDFGKPEEE